MVDFPGSTGAADVRRTYRPRSVSSLLMRLRAISEVAVVKQS